jgi:hypothetical protein
MRRRFEQRAFPKLLIALGHPVLWAIGLLACGCLTVSGAGMDGGASQFHHQIQPMLEEYCFDCHGDGEQKGNVAFDQFKSDQALLENHELWLRVLKNLRAGLMPPPQRKSRPDAEQKEQIEAWIKNAVFKIDPQNLDPGRVTVRRLNRVEYRNTIRDLMGVEFDTQSEFPPDDAGFGFDDIGDLLTLPPMLLEKYFAAANTIVTEAVPSVPAVPAEVVIEGRRFKESAEVQKVNRNGAPAGALVLSYYDAASATNLFEASHAGRYQLLLDFTANERYVENQFDQNKCRLRFISDGKELLRRDYTREGGKAFRYEFDQDWRPGEHELVLEVQPLTPDEKQVRSLTLRVRSVTVRGPMEKQYWVPPREYARFFPRTTPEDQAGRRQYAHEILERFAERAYRRPVDQQTVDRLVGLAEATYSEPGKTFEAGIGQAMTAVLTSPRFLFREEGTESKETGSPVAVSSSRYQLVDEYSLASRLSYFLWSSMPDEELFRLAGRHELHQHLPEQIKRMLADAKSEAFVRNFVGQWLQVRDIDTIQIDARQVLSKDGSADPEREQRLKRYRTLRDKEDATGVSPEEKKELDELRNILFRSFKRPPRVELTGKIRKALRLETEKTFEYIVRENRSLLEFLDSDYTFLNERLAAYYGMTNLNVKGEAMRLVKLPEDDPRGGVITQGSVLIVTSNPTRTSPVKRGKFILENLLGTPPAPPPANIPPLEDAAKAAKGHTLTLRETLALHRDHALCASCHNRMDPLGLALENFNALGLWRTHDQGQPIDATGQLLSGERFTDIRQLKKVLVQNHAVEFYRTLTEKMLIYALGRGLEYYDVGTVDQIVDRLKESNGSPSVLLSGIINSAPFQRTRATPPVDTAKQTEPAAQAAAPAGGL